MKKLSLTLLSLLCVISLLAGCGSGKSAESTAYDYAPSAEAPMAEPNAQYDNGAEMFGLAEEAEKGEGGTTSAAEFGLKIIYTYDFRVETREFDESAKALTAAVKTSGGYVESSSQEGGYYGYNNQYYNPRYSYYTFRIPANKVDGFINSVETVGNVTYRDEYTDDITSAYIDTEARLNSLKTQETRLLALLEKAEDIETLLKIEQELSNVRYEIENYERQIKTYDALVSYSTVSVTLSEVRESAPKAADDFGARISDAFKGSLAGVVEFFKGFVIFLIYALPVFIILGAIAWFIVRPIIKKQRARRIEQQAQYLANAEAKTVDQSKKMLK